MNLKLSTGHVPARVTWEGNVPFVEVVPLARFDPALPFFCQNLRQNAITARVELDRLGCGDETDARAWPSGFIFHMSRCGSTLVSQMLAALPQALVLSEPDALKDILRAPEGVSDRLAARALRSVMSLYAMALRKPGQHLIVKWTSWAVVHLPLIERAFPSVPSCFVTRDPVEVMVSLLEKPSGWLRRKDRGGARERILSGGTGWEEHPSAAQFSARCLARFCEVAASSPCDLTKLDYRELPGAVWDALAPFFGFSLSEEDRAAMRSAACLYSKDPSRTDPFVSDTEWKQRQATAAVRAQAASVVEPALALVRSRLPGPAPSSRPERAARCYQQAMVLYRRGQYLASLQLARSAQDGAGFPSESHDSRLALTLVGKVLAKLRRHAEALGVWLHLLGVAKAQGAAPDAIARLMNAVGENQQGLGHSEEAEKWFREVLRIRLETCGPCHPNFGIALNALATVRHRQGDAPFAERLYRQSCVVQQEALSKDHAHYATALNNLASFLVDCGRLDEALPLYEEAIDIRRHVLGDRDPVYASSISNLAELLRRLGDLERSEHLHRLALDIRVRSLGEDHFLVGCSRAFLGKLLKTRGRLREARSEVNRALDVLLLSVGVEFPLTQRLLAQLSEDW